MDGLVRIAQQKNLPSEQLRAIVELRRQLDRLERGAVLRLRESGVSWDAIARLLGITRQSMLRRAEKWPELRYAHQH